MIYDTDYFDCRRCIGIGCDICGHTGKSKIPVKLRPYMNIKELRIGNYVATQTGEPVIIMTGEAIDNAYKCSGIKLNYDLLRGNCGFIDYAQNGMGCRIEVNSSDELCFYCDLNDLRYQTKGSGFTRDFEIKYLHQLQNIYFILTGGKELIINL